MGRFTKLLDDGVSNSTIDQRAIDENTYPENNPRNWLINNTLGVAAKAIDPYSGQSDKFLNAFRMDKAQIDDAKAQQARLMSGNATPEDNDKLMQDQIDMAMNFSTPMAMWSTRAVRELGPLAGKAANEIAEAIKDVAPQAEHIRNLDLLQDFVKSKNAKSAAGLFKPSEIGLTADRFEQAKRIDMPIQDFLNMAYRMDSPAASKYEPVMDAIKSGKPLDDIPFLTFNSENGLAKINGHEGRHRAYALQDLGYTHIPVNLEGRADSKRFMWGKQGDPSDSYYVKNWPEKLLDQDPKSVHSMDFPVTKEQSLQNYTPINQKYPLLDHGGFKDVYSNKNTDKVIKKFRPDEYTPEDLTPAAIQEQLNFNKMQDFLNPNTKTYKTSNSIYQVQDKHTPMSKLTQIPSEWQDHEDILNYLLKKKGLEPSDLRPDNYGGEQNKSLKVFDTGTFGKIKQIDNNDINALDNTFKTLPMDKEYLQELFNLKAGK